MALSLLLRHLREKDKGQPSPLLWGSVIGIVSVFGQAVIFLLRDHTLVSSALVGMAGAIIVGLLHSTEAHAMSIDAFARLRFLVSGIFIVLAVLGVVLAQNVGFYLMVMLFSLAYIMVNISVREAANKGKLHATHARLATIILSILFLGLGYVVGKIWFSG